MIHSALSLTAAVAALITASSALAEPTVERSVKVAPGGLYEIVFNPADNDLYVAAVGPRGQTVAAIARIDGATLEAEGSIDVASDPFYGLGLNSRTQMLYGTSTRSGSVGVVNLATGVVTHITDGDDDSAHVREAIVDEARNKIYVTVVGGGIDDVGRPNLVWVIDGATQTIERQITVPMRPDRRRSGWRGQPPLRHRHDLQRGRRHRPVERRGRGPLPDRQRTSDQRRP